MDRVEDRAPVGPHTVRVGDALRVGVATALEGLAQKLAVLSVQGERENDLEGGL